MQRIRYICGKIRYTHCIHDTGCIHHIQQYSRYSLSSLYAAIFHTFSTVYGLSRDCFVPSPPEVLLGSWALLRGFAYADAAKSLREAYADSLSWLSRRQLWRLQVHGMRCKHNANWLPHPSGNDPCTFKCTKSVAKWRLCLHAKLWPVTQACKNRYKRCIPVILDDIKLWKGSHIVTYAYKNRYKRCIPVMMNDIKYSHIVTYACKNL